jgi:hypothetical protein
MKEQKLRKLIREEIKSVVQESESDMYALARAISDLAKNPNVEDLGNEGDIHKFRIGGTEYYATTTDKAGQHTMPSDYEQPIGKSMR